MAGSPRAGGERVEGEVEEEVEEEGEEEGEPVVALSKLQYQCSSSL